MNMAQPRQLYAGLVFSGHVCIWPVNALAASCRCERCHQTQAVRTETHSFAVRRSLPAWPVSGVGLRTRPDGEPKVPLLSG